MTARGIAGDLFHGFEQHAGRGLLSVERVQHLQAQRIAHAFAAALRGRGEERGQQHEEREAKQGPGHPGNRPEDRTDFNPLARRGLAERHFERRPRLRLHLVDRLDQFLGPAPGQLSGVVDRLGQAQRGLAGTHRRGVAATVRIDKRGMFGSVGAGDPNVTSAQAYVDDIHAWIDAIKTERGSKCVFLLGHSEGALMVSLAAQGRKDVCGLILVSGMGRKMGDVIREQLTSNPANAPVLDQALRAVSEVEAGRHVDVTGMHPALLPLFNPKVQDYLIAMFAIDPVQAVSAASIDTLIIQGKYQFKPEPPFSPGGGTDTVARALALRLGDARLLLCQLRTRLFCR